MNDVTESDLRGRLTEVDDLIGRHEVALAYLKQEKGDLEMAVRTCERFRNRKDYSEGLIEPPPSPQEESEKPQVKPANLPTMPTMIIEALQEGAAKGTAALTPKDLLAFVRGRYWPEANGENVGPIAWRMWKEGRLQKDDTGAYSLMPDRAKAEPVQQALSYEDPM